MNKEQLIETGYVADLAHMHMNSGSWMTFNNEIDYFNNGKDKFDALIEDIRNAKKHIHLEYYIWRGDDLGRRLTEELAKKAAEGVEVRVLYDGIGNSRLPRHFFDKLHQAGGFTAAFLPRFVVRLNYRNHRKLAIIDGEIGYIGGFNVGDESVGKASGCFLCGKLLFLYLHKISHNSFHKLILAEAVDEIEPYFFLAADKYVPADDIKAFLHPKRSVKHRNVAVEIR